MFRDAKNAYENVSKTTSSSRDLEAAALYKAARQLEVCQQEWDAADRGVKLEFALDYHTRLWSVFEAELADPDHELPVEVRVQVLRLSAFMERRRLEIIAEPTPDKLTTIIQINRQIAAGLSGQP